MQSIYSFVRHISGEVTFHLLDPFNDKLLSIFGGSRVLEYFMRLDSAIILSSLLRLVPLLYGKNLPLGNSSTFISSLYK